MKIKIKSKIEKTLSPPFVNLTVLGWNILAIQIQYAHVSQDWLKITLLLANIGLDSFPKNPLHIYI